MLRAEHLPHILKLLRSPHTPFSRLSPFSDHQRIPSDCSVHSHCCLTAFAHHLMAFIKSCYCMSAVVHRRRVSTKPLRSSKSENASQPIIFHWQRKLNYASNFQSNNKINSFDFIPMELAHIRRRRWHTCTHIFIYTDTDPRHALQPGRLHFGYAVRPSHRAPQMPINENRRNGINDNWINH